MTWSCSPAPARTAPRRPPLFCDNETNDARLFGAADSPPYPKDGINDHVVAGAADGQPGAAGHQGRVLVPGRGRAGRDGRAAPAAATRRLEAGQGGERARAPTSTRSSRAAPAGGRRVLRRAGAGPGHVRDGHGHAPGLRRDAVEQAAVRLRRAPLAGRRSDAADAAGGPADGAQRPLEQLRRLRHHVDARQVGVPVVRGVGHGLPLRRARPRRPGVRQVPAAAAVPGVVPAPERRPARLRVGLRRRQPARAGVGRARGLRHRRRPRPRLPQPRLRQAARQLHVVGEPARTPTAPTCSRAASSDSTTSGRSTARTCRSAACLEQSDATGWMAFYALAMGMHRRRSSTARASVRRPTWC